MCIRDRSIGEVSVIERSATDRLATDSRLMVDLSYGILNNWSSCSALNQLILIGKYLIYCKAINRVNLLFADFKALLHQMIERGWQRGDRDPVSRTNFNKIHTSRFESVIVGESSGKRNFHDQTQIIHESRIPHEINHASHAFRYSRITFPFK